MNWTLWVLLFVAVGIGVWLVSFVVEALRPRPAAPEKLRWAPNIPIQAIEIDGNKLRYIKTGNGPVLVLLHTLRTQLDLFEKVVPELAKHFTVYALDYPGHGHSDIPQARYDAHFFTAAVEGFLDKLDLRDVTLAGVSIGGSIALILASRQNPRLARVIAINPYDYAKGRGMSRAGLFGWIVTYTALVPVIGETVMRLRNFIIMKAVLNGGVAGPGSIPPALLKEMYLVGNRPGHYRAFLSLLRNAESWEAATKDYRRISIPVLLIWGDQDWARLPERDHDRDSIPGLEVTTLEHGGHFLPLDRPRELVQSIANFAGSTASPSRSRASRADAASRS
ncbi:alpha/beta hydrolase [Methyloceanibacter sp.]|uniref:alpha/beta fold hydrolase n=1 Tax=Methyloceanibacter sp. TaxID=1965321 RepID=UPI002D4A87B7|nr:alpha/beta hydrolase [Methyloceanibacter sp.]HZP09722.1 alpha/beta hydrolase [Methyloceanibacter sp.]